MGSMIDSQRIFRYAIKIIYIGDSEMLPGEILISYFKFDNESSIETYDQIDPYDDLFWNEGLTPSLFFDKAQALKATICLRKIWASAVRNGRVPAHCIDMQIFFRVVEWREQDIKNLFQMQCKLTENVNHRRIQKQLFHLRVEKRLSVIDDLEAQ